MIGSLPFMLTRASVATNESHCWSPITWIAWTRVHSSLKVPGRGEQGDLPLSTHCVLVPPSESWAVSVASPWPSAPFPFRMLKRTTFRPYGTWGHVQAPLTPFMATSPLSRQRPYCHYKIPNLGTQINYQHVTRVCTNQLVCPIVNPRFCAVFWENQFCNASDETWI